jgi:hypothetical protein
MFRHSDIEREDGAMKMRIVLAVAALLVGVQGFQAATRTDNPRYLESITVQGTGGHGWVGDFALTFNTPVALPGVSLAPGKYIFRQPLSHILQVSNASGTALKMFDTIPTSRPVATNTFTVQLGDPAAEGSPMRILAIFGPGETAGRELIYPAK